jgi:hypothetical protein
MALPPIDTLCRAIDEFPDALRVRFPGGAQLTPQLSGLPPSLFALAQDLLGKTNAALTPLTPLFDIVEAIVAVQKCLTAVVDALGPPPDPSKLAECLPELAKKIEAIIALLPPTSVLALVADIVDAIVAMLEGVIAELRAVAAIIERTTRAENLSARVPELAFAAICGRQTADAAMSNISRALGSLNTMIELVNGFAALAGLPGLPLVAGLPGDPLGAIGLLQGAVAALRAFRDTIPVS